LPGIAGIVLTVGMAVDANVLIFERIREELRLGNTPQASIYAGYSKAFGTIADANITTFIAAAVLFGFGTGPIQGFAVTLMIGIASSMFTAIFGTRAVINLIYGGKQVSRLAI
jgi:preprotein translocase subunit SecD